MPPHQRLASHLEGPRACRLHVDCRGNLVAQPRSSSSTVFVQSQRTRPRCRRDPHELDALDVERVEVCRAPRASPVQRDVVDDLRRSAAKRPLEWRAPDRRRGAGAAGARGRSSVRHERSLLPVRVEERPQAHVRPLEPSVDLDEERRARPRRARRAPRPSRSPCRARSLQRALVTRPPGRPSTTIWPPSGGTTPFSISKPTSCSRKPRSLHVLERPLAHEVVLVELDDPGHVRLERVRLRVGVLPDEDVHLLEAEDALRLEAERPDAEVGARARGSCPRRARRTGSGSGARSRARRRSRSAGAGRERRRRAPRFASRYPKRLVRDVEVGEPAHELAGPRAGDVDRGEGAGDVRRSRRRGPRRRSTTRTTRAPRSAPVEVVVT